MQNNSNIRAVTREIATRGRELQDEYERSFRSLVPRSLTADVLKNKLPQEMQLYLSAIDIINIESKAVY